ncbi:MAG: ribosomal RNA small subunit methyltransferase A [Oscillospiraceae bacterium]|nr:ribosomal RNA small subunit methyltransferase A [Oscillospiraceae bacterium]
MELTNIGVIKDLFERHGFSFSKALGQNFLINPAVCPKIAEMGGCREGVCAIEIGTGVGVLTRELAKRCDRVIAIELDERLKPILDETLAEFDNVEVIFADVMQTELSEIVNKFGNKETVICANLPYYITSPVIMKILESRLSVKSLTVMVQREAGDRICAAPGTRESGAVSYAVRYYSKPKLLFRVNRGSFMPSPNVDSEVIKLEITNENQLPKDIEKTLFRLIRSGFSQRRKQLLNPLSAELDITKQELSDVFSELKIKPTARAEELTLENYIELARRLTTE